MPDSVEKFAAILDATLKEVNSDYEAETMERYSFATIGSDRCP